MSGAPAAPDLTPRAAWHRSAALIGGEWVEVAATLPVHDPSTEDLVGTAAACGTREVERAITAARAAGAAWARTNPDERAAALEALHAQLLARRGELIAATVAEVGAPVRYATEFHVDISLDIVASIAGLTREFPFEERIGSSRVRHEPAGVVGAITPWNYPLYQVVAKVAPALAAGCTIVVKPAELTPLSAALLGDAAIAAGLPPGVLGIVPGTGSVAGEALVRHPDVDVVSFTGSTRVGRHVAALAADRVARACLELGGKSPSVVLPDADLERAVQGTVDSATSNSGQTCSALTRLLVPQARLDDAIDIAVARAGQLVVGDPRADGTDLGPLISARQRRRVVGFLERALTAGARLAAGDTAHTPPAKRGHYVDPCIVADAERDSEIVQEEVFGPVLCVLPYRDEADAIALANDSRYGLAAAVWSADEERALGVAAQLRAGQVDIGEAAFNPAAPFGGVRQSGIGRELGPHGIAELCELKAIQAKGP